MVLLIPISYNISHTDILTYKVGGQIFSHKGRGYFCQVGGQTVCIGDISDNCVVDGGEDVS